MNTSSSFKCKSCEVDALPLCVYGSVQHCDGHLSMSQGVKNGVSDALPKNIVHLLSQITRARPLMSEVPPELREALVEMNVSSQCAGTVS